MIHGIDVHGRKGAVDWVRVQRFGVSFAWLKASEGKTFVDARFAENRRAAKAAGIRVGAYHYARPDSNTAREEADNFLRLAQPVRGSSSRLWITRRPKPAGSPPRRSCAGRMSGSTSWRPRSGHAQSSTPSRPTFPLSWMAGGSRWARGPSGSQATDRTTASPIRRRRSALGRRSRPTSSRPGATCPASAADAIATVSSPRASTRLPIGARPRESNSSSGTMSASSPNLALSPPVAASRPRATAAS